MNLDRFRQERQQVWSELNTLLRDARHKPHKLGSRRVRRLGTLYRSAAADLALARSRWPGDPVVTDLEALVASARTLVYVNPARTGSALAFFSRGYWRRLRERPIPLAIAALLLLGSGFLSGVWANNDPAGAFTVVPDSARAVTRPREGGRSLGLSADEKAAFSSFIFTNNIRVTLVALAGGVLLGLGTAFILLNNGLILGAIAGLAVGAGNASPFFELTTGHGVLELSCIIVCGAAGLRMGWSIVEPGRGKRVDALVAESRKATEIVLGTAPWLVLAGIVEGFITPSGFGLTAMLLVGFGLGAIYWGLVYWRGRPEPGAATAVPSPLP